MTVTDLMRGEGVRGSGTTAGSNPGIPIILGWTFGGEKVKGGGSSSSTLMLKACLYHFVIFP